MQVGSSSSWTRGTLTSGELVATLEGRRGEFRLYRERPPDPFDVLSPRQRAVAESAVRGKTLRQIGLEFRISCETAKSHLKEVYRRLDIASRTELIQVKRGILSAPESHDA